MALIQGSLTRPEVDKEKILEQAEVKGARCCYQQSTSMKKRKRNIPKERKSEVNIHNKCRKHAQSLPSG